ncbi:MAG TPA: M20/M25/M40 family metallo-hydrolase [Thermoanaerobaculia bacterium]|nr:M20/M25/M40 family metallo-hydrolase [Thermoanaerobaculia bacterium]
MMLPEREVLALHEAITAIRSVSGEEAELADFLEQWWLRRGVVPLRLGNSLLLLSSGPPGAAARPAAAAGLPLLLLDTHLDTVPPVAGWSRDPWDSRPEGGKVYGLGANDAKAAVAGMVAAFAAFAEVELPFTLALALVEGEETRGTGTMAVLEELARQGRRPAAAVIGEPTGLDLAIAQKGLLVLELVARGDACHAAHARALGAANAARRLARDLVALEDVDLGPPHARLGAVTIEPTQLRAGTARNVVPDEAVALLDVRTTPALPAAAVVERIRQAVGGEVRVVSDRLAPRETAAGAAVVEAARRVRPEARLYGSATLSDMVFMADVPAVKCGPGDSQRSHTADEFVWQGEVLAGARFYTRLVGSYAEEVASRGSWDQAGAPAGPPAAQPRPAAGVAIRE